MRNVLKGILDNFGLGKRPTQSVESKISIQTNTRLPSRKAYSRSRVILVASFSHTQAFSSFRIKAPTSGGRLEEFDDGTSRFLSAPFSAAALFLPSLLQPLYCSA